jgi:hypothetical protein
MVGGGVSAPQGFVSDLFSCSVLRVAMSKSASTVLRYKPSRRRKPFREQDYQSGIEDEAIDKLVGGILTLWPHVEEMMIPMFAELIGTTDQNSARLIFRSIINNNTRIEVMRAMLQRAPQHRAMGPCADALIDEFHALSRIRNGYAHGLWRTRKKDGKVFLEGEDRPTYDLQYERRRITESELVDIHERVKALLSGLLEFHWGFKARAEQRTLLLEASPEKQAPKEGGTRQ